jgi:prepilin peptidase CpaA
MLLYAVGGGRGGDVKLLAAVGAICRTTIGIEAVFYAFLIAAIYAQARLAYEGKLLRTLGNTVAIVVNPFLPKARRRKLSKEAMTWTRLGPSVFAGTVVAVLLNWSLP